MKRSAALRRTKPLVTRTPLHRVAGLRPRRRRHMATNTPAVRENLTKAQRFVLWCLFGGRCAGCGRLMQYDEMEACHRVNRGQGGNNTALWNRWPGCATCHRLGRKSQARQLLEYERRGLYVRSTVDPRTVPVELWDGRRGFITAAATFEDVPA